MVNHGLIRNLTGRVLPCFALNYLLFMSIYLLYMPSSLCFSPPFFAPEKPKASFAHASSSSCYLFVPATGNKRQTWFYFLGQMADETTDPLHAYP